MALEITLGAPLPKDAPLPGAGEGLLRAGQWASGGLYEEVESRRVVCLEEPGPLPASFDGRVACYIPLQTWEMLREQEKLDNDQ